jgi:radical SAM superfamily enzyme YgiQ (UPF0313 family)
MSEYGGSIFLGFSAVVPKGLVPDPLYFSLFCPPIEANKDGSATVSPCGTRKVEAALLRSGFARQDVIVAHPDHLDKVIGPATKVLGVTENDPLGIGPATSTFNGIFAGEPYMRLKLRQLLSHPSIVRFRPKVFLGGPGAWQLSDAAKRMELGIDCVVMGEAEEVVPGLFRQALEGKKVPGLAMGTIVEPERIPTLAGPTIDGIVEVSRGCGRGCEFCVPTLAKYRNRELADILEDVRVNLEGGRPPLLHAEDVVRYGAKHVEVDEERVCSLFESVAAVPGVERISISHFALASVASAPRAVERMSQAAGVDDDHWLGGQTGIETASPELMRRYMSGKCRPFTPEQWPDVVRQAFGICSDNKWLPCGTIIMGLPGEKGEDVQKTLELTLSLREHRSLIVPLFFVATAELTGESESFNVARMSRLQTELFLTCWEHNLHWAPPIIEDWAKRSLRNPLARAPIKMLLRFGIHETREIIKMCREDYDYDMNQLIADVRSREISLIPSTARSLAATLPHPLHAVD